MLLADCKRRLSSENTTDSDYTISILIQEKTCNDLLTTVRIELWTVCIEVKHVTTTLLYAFGIYGKNFRILSYASKRIDPKTNKLEHRFLMETSFKFVLSIVHIITIKINIISICI